MYQRIIQLLILLNLFALSSAQLKSEFYPVQFNQYTRCFSLINPASTCMANNFETNLGYKKYLGGFSTISTFYSYTGLRINDKDKKPGHNAFGLRFDTDQEGKYISRSRFYGIYTFHTQFTKNYYFAAGIDFGMFNMKIKGTPNTGNISTFVPDANAGVWIWGQGYKFGIAINQLFNSTLKPFEESIELPTHMNLMALKCINFTNKLSLTPSILFRYPWQEKYNADYTFELSYSNFSGGLSLRRRLGIAFFTGVNEIKVMNGFFNVTISYHSPVSGSDTNISTFEISLEYFTRKGKNFNNGGLHF